MFLVTTVSGNVTITDLNGLVLTHPTVDQDLELTFTAQEISESTDLQAALVAGTVTASDGTNAIVNVKAALAADHEHFAGQVLFDNTASGFTSVELQGAIDEIDTNLDQVNTDIGNINTSLGDYQLLSEKNVANGYAGLGATGLISAAQLPGIAITSVNVVADIPARDALTVEEGDVAIVLDADGFGNKQSYIFDGAAWQILSVSGIVTSVAGKTGDVLIDMADISDVDLTGLAIGDQLQWDGTNFVAVTPASAGESNTASNVGTAGVGVFKQKTLSDLEFKKINTGSTKVTITDDTVNDEIDIDIVPGNILTSELNNDAAFVDAAGAAAAAPVQSVNGATGIVSLDSDDITQGTTNLYMTTAEKLKLGFISVTQAVDLDQMELDIATNTTKLDFITITQAVDLDQMEIDVTANTAKVSADGSVTTHSDVTDAGSGAIITVVERGKIGNITITQAVDLDQMEIDVTANNAKISADGSIDTHSDVDTTTVAPIADDFLQFDGTNFVPVAVPVSKRGVLLELHRQGNFSNDWLRFGSSGIKSHESPLVPEFASGMKIREITISHRRENGASSVTTLDIHETVIADAGDLGTSDTVTFTKASTAGGVTNLTSNGRTWKYDATADNIVLDDANRYAFRISETGNGNLGDVLVRIYLEEV